MTLHFLAKQMFRHSAATTVFTVFAMCHVVLLALQLLLLNDRGSSAGATIVAFIAGALVWDNGLIAWGGLTFPNAVVVSSPDYRWLATLSQPRFVAHALLTPLLAVQAAELGARTGIHWVRTAWLVFSPLSLVGLLHHLHDPQLTLKRPHPKEPKGSWMRQLTVFTLGTLGEKKPPPSAQRLALALLIGPAVLVCLFTLFVGVSMARLDDGPSRTAGHWLWVCSLMELLSNGGPPW